MEQSYSNRNVSTETFEINMDDPQPNVCLLC